MRITIMLVLALATAAGCAGAPKPVGRLSQAETYIPPTDERCPRWNCPQNGTRRHGTPGDSASRIESVTLPAASR